MDRIIVNKRRFNLLEVTYTFVHCSMYLFSIYWVDLWRENRPINHLSFFFNWSSAQTAFLICKTIKIKINRMKEIKLTENLPPWIYQDIRLRFCYRYYDFKSLTDTLFTQWSISIIVRNNRWSNNRKKKRQRIILLVSILDSLIYCSSSTNILSALLNRNAWKISVLKKNNSKLVSIQRLDYLKSSINNQIILIFFLNIYYREQIDLFKKKKKYVLFRC